MLAISNISTVASQRIRDSTITNKRMRVVASAGPSPAWPGRAVAPESHSKRDGPKVRDLPT